MGVSNGDEMTLSFDIFEHAFYLTYAINGIVLLDNALTSFDGQVCGVSECNPSKYGYFENVERTNVPVSAVRYPTYNADAQGCNLESQISDYWRNSKTYSSHSLNQETRSANGLKIQLIALVLSNIEADWMLKEPNKL